MNGASDYEMSANGRQTVPRDHLLFLRPHQVPAMSQKFDPNNAQNLAEVCNAFYSTEACAYALLRPRLRNSKRHSKFVQCSSDHPLIIDSPSRQLNMLKYIPLYDMRIKLIPNPSIPDVLEPDRSYPAPQLEAYSTR